MLEFALLEVTVMFKVIEQWASRASKRVLPENLDVQFGISSPRNSGFNTVQAIQAMESKGKVFMGMGGNFARATPDSSRTEEALKKAN